ncbi:MULTISPECIES: amino acid ABC transporter permease [Sphingomonas]|jgi:polar amino acid transport system permease protein|uniref:Amino acid ABC transporter permease n=1 Tax=Sphingomonas olei TaxID=1886787 RepID=A0ABY2QHQ9_9SPHN|nr:MULTISPECIES: amino acid ABC transporter permease [Sphingomonas]KKI18090.1 amino acid ABC transporter [Sphingomonas sp. Ag1]MDF2602793.1 amino acid transporter [Sphingomonas sp.]THG40245.1 amino acid ABC transporter permease [Sphingomonas olei]
MIESIVESAPRFFTPGVALFLLGALWRTIVMTAIGCSLGFAFGMGLAVLRRTRAPALAPLRFAAMLVVETFRRLPFLVLLILSLFATQIIAPELSLLGIATVAITLYATAYLSEIIRAGLDSVPRTQVEGAEALNFNAWQVFWLVVLPQSWRIILPPATAFIVMFIKDTSLASHLGVVELTFSGKILVNRGFPPTLGFGAVLILYFLLSWPLGLLAKRLENRLAPSRRP